MSRTNFNVAERLMRYVQLDTQSDPDSSTFPSSEKQKMLANLLVEELRFIGLIDAHMDVYGYVMATIPSTIPFELQQLAKTPYPVICFCAHLDTAPDCSGKDVKPIYHKEYNGLPIILPDDPAEIITTTQYPYLQNFLGKDVITASGKTLLGADDKAGIAIIVEAAAYLMAHPSIMHAPIKIVFTPDEEVGKGADYLDIKKLGADFAYTLDGGALGSFEMETFSADAMTLHIQGVIAHPGYAKGIMQNAIKIAAAILVALPTVAGSPEESEGKQGFIHPNYIEGDAAAAKIEFLIRDFETANLALYEEKLLATAQKIIAEEEGYYRASVQSEVKVQYRNMKTILEQHPIVLATALKAYEKAGIKPVIEPIRGGTDGSRMSFMGLPTANIFTGMQAIHSKHEWIGVEDMEKAVEVLIHLVDIN